MSNELLYTLHDVLKMTSGLTYRQIYYWAKHGAITPAVPAQGSGSRMLWSTRDVARLQTLSDALLAFGSITVETVREIWDGLATQDEIYLNGDVPSVQITIRLVDSFGVKPAWAHQ